MGLRQEKVSSGTSSIQRRGGMRSSTRVASRKPATGGTGLAFAAGCYGSDASVRERRMGWSINPVDSCLVDMIASLSCLDLVNTLKGCGRLLRLPI